MAGDLLGRKIILTIDGNPVASVRTKSFTINNESVDVTDGDDDGVRKLLSEPGEKSVDMSVDGVFLSTSTALLDLALSNDVSKPVVFNFGAFTVSGNFFMSSYQLGAPYKDATTFSASFNSAAAVAKAAV